VKHWPVQDAKARFSELLEASINEGPQMVTKRGVEMAVLVPVEEWKRLASKPRKSAIDVLLHDPRRFELDIPKRSDLFGVRDPAKLD
jgi:prevent-host-death family protein